MSRQKVYSEEEILDAVRCFPNWRKFKTVSSLRSMAKQIRRSGMVDHYFPGERRRASGYDLDGLRYLVSKFKTLLEFRTAYLTVYSYIVVNHLQDEVYHEALKNPSVPTKEQLAKIESLVKACPVLSVFESKYPAKLSWLRTNGLIDQYFKPEMKNKRIKSLKKYSLEKLKIKVAKYESLTEFQKHARPYYEYIKFHGLQKEVYPEGYGREKLSDSDILAMAKSLKTMPDEASLAKTYPRFHRVLIVNKINPSDLIGKDLPEVLAVINAKRKRKITADETNDQHAWTGQGSAA